MNRRTTALLTLGATSILAILGAGCVSGGRSDPPPDGWKTVRVLRVVAVEPVLTFTAPADLKETPVQGEDSLAKAYRSPTIELNLGYGPFSDPLKYDDKPGYSRTEVTIDGRNAYIVTYDNVVALHVPTVRLLSRDRLTLWARCSDADARDRVQRLFRSIRFR